MRGALLLLFGLLPGAYAMSNVEGLRLSTAEFERLHAEIVPDESQEAWTQIPWSTNLWATRQRAVAEGKPIFMWAMNGHPLGCV